jgi:hypothetical protein
MNGKEGAGAARLRLIEFLEMNNKQGTHAASKGFGEVGSSFRIGF